jgi:hypothetical protein
MSKHKKGEKAQREPTARQCAKWLMGQVGSAAIMDDADDALLYVETSSRIDDRNAFGTVLARISTERFAALLNVWFHALSLLKNVGHATAVRLVRHLSTKDEVTRGLTVAVLDAFEQGLTPSELQGFDRMDDVHKWLAKHRRGKAHDA